MDLGESEDFFVDGADGEWGGVSPAQVVTSDQHVSSKNAPNLTN